MDQRLLALEAQRLHLDRDPKVKRRLAAARDKVLGDAALDHEIEAQVGDKALRALYDEELKQAQPQYELHRAQIVTPTEAEAQAVKAQLAGGADFAALAQTRSIDMATRYAGGDLGWLRPRRLPGAFGAALATAQAGRRGRPAAPRGRLCDPEGGGQARPAAAHLRAGAAADRALPGLRPDQTLLKRLRAETEVAILKPQKERPR